ncbi:ATP-dependent DNA ligase [Agromyces mediolanus]|uniref:DNA ligase (ATP) n=1 Tax=Agromyces mediolanus TaxID=41986 RepID=A0A918CKS2_AGRME|nr:ATP-dependent DNA ligase [Agromyces mediolanus]GGR28045.1 ATP-dependent DNA ligase [Agromyces mediolanus]GLJ72018.1 ATP-dependent DNA ligase [Agromyces mediolanus]
MADAERQLVEVDGRRLRLTNLDKVMYPETGTTKGEVISYYAEIAAVMVPHVAGRPVTRKRWVHGVGTAEHPETPFFEKNLAEHAPEWLRRGVIQHSDGPKTYPIAGDRASLVWMAQQAALELHVPQWRFAPDGSAANPDRMVFDFDPGEGVGLAECAEVARLVRDLIGGMGLEAVPVTSGSKGLHLYAGLDGSQSSEQVSDVAHELARALEADHPELIVSSMRKALRTGKVLIDWSQNNGKKTTIAPYSLRGRLRPSVAAPREWAELDEPGFGQLEFHEVLARVAASGDPMARLGCTTAPGGDALDAYRAKRTVGATPEPIPAARERIESAGADAAGATDASGRRFTIQEHHARRLHFDLRLERDGVLRSWAVPKGVPETTGVNHLAVQTEDHPLEYLDFEGTIPAGEYGAGSMTVWDTGEYELEKWRDDELIFTLEGRVGGPLGRVRLALIRTDGEGEKSSWLLHRMKEQRAGQRHAGPAAASEASAVPAPPEASASSLAAPAPRGTAGRPPRIPYAPMLAVAGAPGLAGDDRALEWKWDGIRVLARVEDGASRLASRTGRDVTEVYPELAGLASALRADAVVDGEIVALDEDGRPDFGLLQHRMNLADAREIAKTAPRIPVRLLLFDVLEVAGSPTVDEPYRRRRERLERLLRPGTGAPVEVPAPAEGSVETALAEAERLGLEGVMAKRLDSPYRAGERSDDWLKLKLARTQEVVIGGYRRGVGTRTGRIRSLLLGLPGERGLEYVGRVGSGFRERELDRLLARFRELERETSPFVEVPAADAADAVWLRPELVGEIEFGSWTRTGVVRHARWRGLRPDLDPAGVRREGG